MFQKTSPLVRWFAIITLIGAWAGFFALNAVVASRIRCFAGWETFLSTSPTAHRDHCHANEVTQVVIVLPNDETPPTPLPTVVITQPPIIIAQPTPLPPTTPPVARLEPTTFSCPHSLPSRFAVGMRGRVPAQANGLSATRIYDRAGDEAGFQLSPDVTFEVIGGPTCAFLLGHSFNNVIFWQIRLLNSRSEGRVGWVAESLSRERIYYITPMSR
jgi:hypothetical protein